MTSDIQQPRPNDIVGNPLHVGGIGQGFEATLAYRIHDGHDQRTGYFNLGGGAGEHGQFALSVDLTGAAFQLDRLFVEIFEESAADGSEINKASVPVIYGPRIVPGYIGYRLHTVKVGDTLSKIASAHYGSPSHFSRILRANPLAITDPNRVFVGTVLKIPIGT